MLGDEAQGGAVEGAGLKLGAHAEGPQPVPQLVCGLPAERADQHVGGMGGAVLDAPSDSQREDPRLAGAGARQDAHDRIVGEDGRTLGGLEPGDELGDVLTASWAVCGRSHSPTRYRAPSSRRHPTDRR